VANLYYQAYSAGSFDWRSTSATGPGKEAYQVFANWVTAVNANPDMASRQIAIVYDPTQATTPGTHFGWMANVKKSDNSNLYFQHYVNSTTATWHIGDVHTPGTANGGYGTVTSPTSADAPAAGGNAAVPVNTANAVSVYIGTGTVNKEEFFLISTTKGNTSVDWHVVMLAKDQDNEWMMLSYSSSSWTGGGIYPNLKVAEIGSNSISNTVKYADTAYVVSPLVWNINNYAVQTGPLYKGHFAVKSNDIGHYNAFDYPAGSYINMGDGTLFMSLGFGYQPWLRFTPTV